MWTMTNQDISPKCKDSDAVVLVENLADTEKHSGRKSSPGPGRLNWVNTYVVLVHNALVNVVELFSVRSFQMKLESNREEENKGHVKQKLRRRRRRQRSNRFGTESPVHGGWIASSYHCQWGDLETRIQDGRNDFSRQTCHETNQY